MTTPSSAQRRVCERFWKHLKTTEWKVIGPNGNYQNCLGWAVQVNSWLEDFSAADELNQAFVYKTLTDHGFTRVQGNTPPATGESIALYRKGTEIVHFSRIVNGQYSSKLGDLWCITHEPTALYEGEKDGDYGVITEFWHKGAAQPTLTTQGVMEPHVEPTEDELTLVQFHAEQARTSAAPAKKPAPPKTTPKPAPPKTAPKPAPPKTTPTPAPPKTAPKPAPPKTTPTPAPPKTAPKPAPPKTAPKPTPPKTTPAPAKPDNKLAGDFDKAFAAWLAELAENPSSKTSGWLKVPTYASLKKLGAAIVPLLTDKLAKGELRAAVALRDIDKAKLQGKVTGSSLQQAAAAILKLEAAHTSATTKTIAAFAERKEELKPQPLAEDPSTASEEAKKQVLADPLFEAVVSRGHAAVPEILARLEHEHENEHDHGVWLEVLAQIHAIEENGDRTVKSGAEEFEAWLDKYVREEEQTEEGEHHEGEHQPAEHLEGEHEESERPE